MIDYAMIAARIKETLEADAWLGDVANVKTIEVDKRGYLIQEKQVSLFFDYDEMPAIAITPLAGPAKEDDSTTNEIEVTVTSQLDSVSRNRDRQDGLNAHYALVKNLENVLRSQKTSAKDLNGLDAYVDTVATNSTDFKDGEYYYFVSTTEITILLTEQF